MDELDNRNVMQILIDNGANVNAKNNYGLTPLHYAVLYRNHCVIDILIQSGADINAKSCLKRTALHFAISNYQHQKWKRTLPSDGDGPDMWMVEKLLDQQNIRVNARDIRGDTPLMWAVMDKQVDIALALLRKGANPNIRNKDSLTPLHVALSDEDPCCYVVVALLLHLANLNIADKEGRTPIDILIQHVRNTQSYQFAYTCLETIAFTHDIKKHQWRKLEKIPELTSYLEKCRVEVAVMKLDVLANGLTVFRFMLLGANDSDFENPVLQVYEPIVKRLLAGIYPKYLYHILDRIPKSVLCIIFEILFMKSWEMISNTVSGEKSDNNGCEETSDNVYCDETSDNHSSEETSNIDDCEETSNIDDCEETSNIDDCEETSNIDDCEDTSDNDDHEDTSDNDDHEDTSDNDYCDETSDNDGSEETPNIDHCETSDNDGRQNTLDNDGYEDRSDNDYCAETSDNDGSEKTSDNYGREEPSDNDGHQNTLDNDGCEDASGSEERSVNDGCETFENNGYEEVSVNGDCRKAWDIEGRKVVQRRIKGDPRDFFTKIDIFILSKYLSRLDIFCLIVALSKGKIHECMRHIRNRKYE